MKIRNAIYLSVDYAVQSRCQDDAELSQKLFKSITTNVSWCDPLDKRTWERKSATRSTEALKGNWPFEIIQHCDEQFSMELEVVRAFLDELVVLVRQKEDEEAGISSKYLGNWIKRKFPELKFGKASKRQRLIEVLKEQKIIKVVEKGRPSLGRATTWTLGSVGAAAIGVVEKMTEVDGDPVIASIVRFPFRERRVECPFTCTFKYDEDGRLAWQRELDGPFELLSLDQMKPVPLGGLIAEFNYPWQTQDGACTADSTEGDG